MWLYITRHVISTYIVPVEGASDDEEDCDVEITFTPRHIEHVWQCHLQAMSCHCHQTKNKIISNHCHPLSSN